MIQEVQVKSALNKHKKRDDWFLDVYSVNPYVGCTFNCTYCYIHGSKYGNRQVRGLSVKINVLDVLERQLRRRARKNEQDVTAIATATEPYQKIEEKLQVTRRILKLMSRYRFPVHVLTKSTLVLRDLDILKEIDTRAILPDAMKPRLDRGVIITLSLSTLDERLARILEPGAPTPTERLETVQKCKEAGFLTGVAFIPTLPFLSDSKETIETMVHAAKEHGAEFVHVGALTLFGKGPTDCRTRYYKFLNAHYPELVPRYKNLYGTRMQPPRNYQAELELRADDACKKHDIMHHVTRGLGNMRM